MGTRALNILGETVLLGRPVGAHDAGDWSGARQALLLHQQLERPIAPASGGNLEHAGLRAVGVEHRTDGDALQQRAAGDVFGELFDGDAGLDPPDVRLGQEELIEGNVA
jgi:hypothetical protein